jgi:hypothetical protein
VVCRKLLQFGKMILPTLAQHDIKCGKFNFEFLNCLVSCFSSAIVNIVGGMVVVSMSLIL